MNTHDTVEKILDIITEACCCPISELARDSIELAVRQHGLYTLEGALAILRADQTPQSRNDENQGLDS